MKISSASTRRRTRASPLSLQRHHAEPQRLLRALDHAAQGGLAHGAMKGRFSTVDQYLSLVYQSDRAFEYLVDYFSRVEEPTMILMYGDHQPQVATNFYTELLGSSPTAAQAQKKQAVPFVLWANYDIPEQEGVETSINYLSSLLIETARLPMTGYQQFLRGLSETVPAVNAVGYMDTDGSWHENLSELSQTARDALGKYQILQYNELFDDRENRLEDFFFLPGRNESSRGTAPHRSAAAFLYFDRQERLLEQMLPGKSCYRLRFSGCSMAAVGAIFIIISHFY